ncbi:thioesterase [Brevibacillus composti]|uniref:Thioesterase n=1 Tax=Brevibacillus composti TaxID=2796470 RepID=A0A7T5JM66_9BACL|nr:alpha/beta fold hydrolase [Brevibacillus composti]QQE72794.1 thioesterase [Brevibacillus composti]QUO39873.1 thioesterase [Brevibacillus composti]
MPKYKLFCLPHAGGSASAYAKWKPLFLPRMEVVPVELAGRGARLKEKLNRSMEHAVFDIYEQIQGQVDEGPYAILGHSMGSLLAFELLHQLSARGHRLPQLAVFSGSNPPHRPVGKRRHLLSDEELREELLLFGGTPEELLLHEELLEIIMPIIRADFQIVETYRPQNTSVAFDCDFLVLQGKADLFTSAKQAGEWGRYTRRLCHLEPFPGGHFILFEHEEEIARLILQKMEAKTRALFLHPH